jgi:hypothetical protein
MGYKITVNHADAEKDTVFDIRGLGAFLNGKPREVSDEEAAQFEAVAGYSVKDIKADYIKVESSSTKTTGGDN